MRCFLIFTIPLLISLISTAQKNKKTEEDRDISFTKVEVNAGTDARAWAAYLKKAVLLPDSLAAIIPPGVHQIKVKFIVDQYGNIGDIKAAGNPGYGLARRAEKIIAQYEGVWQPANQCGRSVKSYKEQVVEFVVKE